MSPEIQQKLMIMLGALFTMPWVFIGIIVFLGSLGQVVGFPILGGFTALTIACVYVYFKGIMG